MEMKSIRVYLDTYNKIRAVGVYGESMDDILDKCVEAYNKLHKKIEVVAR